MGVITILKLAGVGIVLASLVATGCTIKRMVNAEKLLTKCENERSLANENAQNLSDGFESGVKEAAAKGGEGAKLDCQKRQYKLDAQACKKLAKEARERAKDIARQSSKVVN